MRTHPRRYHLTDLKTHSHYCTSMLTGVGAALRDCVAMPLVVLARVATLSFLLERRRRKGGEGEG